MLLTPNYSLKKPEGTDVVNIDDLNGNADIIDAKLKELNDSKASKNIATTSTSGLMSNTDKTKLDGIATGANKYTHPANHPATIITEDATHRFVTDTEKNTWNGKAGTAVATTSTNGLMSKMDKSKLDGIAANANNYVHPTSHLASMIKTDDGSDVESKLAEKMKKGNFSETSIMGNAGGDWTPHTGLLNINNGEAYLIFITTNYCNTVSNSYSAIYYVACDSFGVVNVKFVMENKTGVINIVVESPENNKFVIKNGGGFGSVIFKPNLNMIRAV